MVVRTRHHEQGGVASETMSREERRWACRDFVGTKRLQGGRGGEEQEEEEQEEERRTWMEMSTW